MLTTETRVALDIPRDRDGSFEPQLIAKHQRRLPGFDDKVISLYARGLPVREIQGHLTELYGLEVSPDQAEGARTPIKKAYRSSMVAATRWRWSTKNIY